MDNLEDKPDLQQEDQQEEFTEELFKERLAAFTEMAARRGYHLTVTSQVHHSAHASEQGSEDNSSQEEVAQTPAKDSVHHPAHASEQGSEENSSQEEEELEVATQTAPSSAEQGIPEFPVSAPNVNMTRGSSTSQPHRSNISTQLRNITQLISSKVNTPSNPQTPIPRSSDQQLKDQNVKWNDQNSLPQTSSSNVEASSSSSQIHQLRDRKNKRVSIGTPYKPVCDQPDQRSVNFSQPDAYVLENVLGNMDISPTEEGCRLLEMYVAYPRFDQADGMDVLFAPSKEVSLPVFKDMLNVFDWIIESKRVLQIHSIGSSFARDKIVTSIMRNPTASPISSFIDRYCLRCNNGYVILRSMFLYYLEFMTFKSTVTSKKTEIIRQSPDQSNGLYLIEQISLMRANPRFDNYPVAAILDLIISNCISPIMTKWLTKWRDRNDHHTGRMPWSELTKDFETASDTVSNRVCNLWNLTPPKTSTSGPQTNNHGGDQRYNKDGKKNKARNTSRKAGSDPSTGSSQVLRSTPGSSSGGDGKPINSSSKTSGGSKPASGSGTSSKAGSHNTSSTINSSLSSKKE